MIPTAEKFISNLIEKAGDRGNYDIEEALREFAQLHVQAALEAAYNQHEIVRSKKKLDDYDYADSFHYTVDKRSILNAYPKSLII